jgi:V-type H+-transporting ATPase subunit a
METNLIAVPLSIQTLSDRLKVLEQGLHDTQVIYH